MILQGAGHDFRGARAPAIDQHNHGVIDIMDIALGLIFSLHASPRTSLGGHNLGAAL